DHHGAHEPPLRRHHGGTRRVATRLGRSRRRGEAARGGLTLPSVLAFARGGTTAMHCRTRRRPRKVSPNSWSITRASAKSPSVARSRSSSPFQAAAHGMRDVLPGRTARPFGRRALLVDDVKELVSIGHRDPVVAHPDVERALILLVGVLRKLCALGRHPPCVVGFRSHRPAFYRQ